ncbi:MAG: PAS domain S-box protein [Longimicrobiales bacterium]
MISANYKAIFDSSPDGILLVDTEGTIRRANVMAQQLFGYASEELEGQPVETLVPAASRGSHSGHRERYQRTSAVRPMGIGMELRAVRRGGVEFPVEISLAPTDGPDGQEWTVATVRDVSMRKRLRDFGTGALRASEDERARIARELHDDTAQRLATILVRLKVLEKDIDDPDLLQRLDDVRQSITDTAEGVRRIARGLRPPELEDAGLESALRSFTRMLREGRGMDVVLDVDPVDRFLTPDGRLILYRIVQEALNNAVRHAGAPQARVHIRAEEDHIVGLVEDHGAGFFPQHLALQGGGLGLLGMQERAVMLGGHVSVESLPGQGTRVRIRIPVEIAEEMGRV